MHSASGLASQPSLPFDYVEHVVLQHSCCGTCAWLTSATHVADASDSHQQPCTGSPRFQAPAGPAFTLDIEPKKEREGSDLQQRLHSSVGGRQHAHLNHRISIQKSSAINVGEQDAPGRECRRGLAGPCAQLQDCQLQPEASS